MIITCEVDQFLCVEGISNNGYSSRIIISKYYDLRDTEFGYLPKEIFNMVKIDTINFLSFVSSRHYHLSLPKNHYFCKWNNLVNLGTVQWLHLSLYKECENGQIRLLNLCN